ncbi:hypothetical protein [Bradyrhizobium sp. Ce-3]|uniref:hypothetical protein n=1 Tax=Bradyrhizobium sp. Ce-3 TaxID=2913970 RepID=UPI001FC83EF6|nr:hypothetical protein [Bradyrhizobium sp. Ce-3]GKQ51624.1 hypothetical protein BRSPCE3_24790 [Bradyrhizobium sp. Ce-3]
MHSAPRNILLLCAAAALKTNTVSDHIRAFRQYGQHKYTIVDSLAFEAIGADLDSYDCVILHYSIVISMENYIPASLRERLRRFKGVKVAFIQDEYRFVDRQNAALADLQVGVIFTVTNPDVTRKIYRDKYFQGVRFEHTLTGFVPEHLLSMKVPSYAERPRDVSYRARKTSPWLGSFAEEKWRIADRFAADAAQHNLVCDIDTSETSRVYGGSWIDFVASSKAVLGTESGVSFIDFTGDIQIQVERFCAENPDVPHEVVRQRFLGDDDGKIVIRVVSPRIFEAAALRTLMVLYEGDYSGAVKPWEHYVPLRRDHGNMAEVVSIIRDPSKAQAIIDRAFHEVALSPAWTFRQMVERFDSVVDDEAQRLGLARSAIPETLGPLELAISTHGLQWVARGQYLEEHVLPAYNGLVEGHQELGKHYQRLNEYYQGLVESYQSLAKDYQRLAGDHQRLVGNHQSLAQDNQSLAEHYQRLAQDLNLPIRHLAYARLRQTLGPVKRKLMLAFQQLKALRGEKMPSSDSLDQCTISRPTPPIISTM